MIERTAAAVSGVTSVVELAAIVRSLARQAAGSDGATFVVREADRCFYVDEDAIAPLWKGQRFPIAECISGWAMTHGEVAVVPDIREDDRVLLVAYRPTFVRSMVMVPVGPPHADAAIGAYWARHHRATEGETAGLVALAEVTHEAMARIGLDDAPWAPNFRHD